MDYLGKQLNLCNSTKEKGKGENYVILTTLLSNIRIASVESGIKDTSQNQNKRPEAPSDLEHAKPEAYNFSKASSDDKRAQTASELKRQATPITKRPRTPSEFELAVSETYSCQKRPQN